MKRRIKSPPVLQYEATECGAASLKIVMAFMGRVVPLAQLRDRCGVSRDGVTASQIKFAAESYGLKVHAYRCSADQLKKQAYLPSILFWNFNHFLVLEGFEANNVFLNDPAFGRRSICWDEFLTSFTGVVMDFKAGPDFKYGGMEPKLYHLIPKLFSPYSHLVPWLLLISLFGVIPELFIAGSTSQFIDSYLQNSRGNIGIGVIWITSISALILIGLLNLKKQLLRIISTHLMKRLSSLLYVSLFSLPFKFFLQRSGGELSQRLLLPFMLVTLGINGVIDFLLSLGSGIIALIGGSLISPWLALFTLFITGGNAVLNIWIRELRKAENLKLAMLKGKNSGIGMSMIQAVESIKASGLENEAFVKWSVSFNEWLEEIQKQSLSNSLLGVVGSTSGFILRSGIILLGGLLIILGQLSLGQLMAFQFLVSLIQEPLQQITTFNSQLQNLDGEMGRLNDIVDTNVEPTIRSFHLSAYEPSSSFSNKMKGHLSISDLFFQFSHNTPLMFEGLSVDLQPGQHLAIVGSSGCGKSTLLRIICGLFQPSLGSILYDNRKWMDLDDTLIRNSLALVSQDVFLFAATVEENLSLWDNSFTHEGMLEALKEAGLFEELGGAAALQKIIHEGGTNLSGGQRQRIEIARALLRKPTILLMDEATSALDEKRERQVMQAIKHHKTTLITVAHRLYSAEISDLVLVLEHGKPVAIGHPVELAAVSGGPYKRLLDAELIDSERS